MLTFADSRRPTDSLLHCLREARILVAALTDPAFMASFAQDQSQSGSIEIGYPRYAPHTFVKITWVDGELTITTRESTR